MAEELCGFDELHNGKVFEHAPIAICEADITEMQARFDALRATGVTSLRSLMESDPDQVLHTLALMKVRKVNQASVALLEAHDEPDLLKNIPTAFATVPRSVLIDAFVARWENRRSFYAETRMITLQGKDICVLAGISVPWEEGRFDLGRIIITMTDITERKRLEEVRRESAERVRMAMEACRVGCWDWNLRTDVLTLDDQCKSLLGVPLDAQVTFASVRERLRPQDRLKADELLQAALATPGDYEMECAAQWPDGSIHWALIRGRSIHSRSGVPLRLMGVAADVTSRRHAEEALRDSEEQFRVMAETVPEVIFTKRPDGSCDYSNPRFYEYTGLPPGSAEGFGWTQVLHPEDSERVQAAWNESLATGQPFESEYRLRATDGSYHWFLGRARPIRNEQGQIIRWFGTSTDVDHVKRIERELSDREALLRMAEEAGGIGSFEYNMQTGRARISPQLSAIYGAEFGSQEGTYETWAKRVHPDDWKLIESCLGSFSPEHPQWRCEYRIFRPDGEIRWLEVRARTQFDDRGEPATIIGVNVDITERRHMEESLRGSEEFYRTLIETLPVTVVLADAKGVITYISPAAKEMFGLEPGEGLGTAPTDWIAPEYHGVVLQRMHAVLVELRPQPPVEYRMLRRDGSSVWCQLTSAPILDAQRQLKGVITVCQDVTERKQVEESLSKLNETLEQQVAERTAVAEHRANQLRVLASELAQAEQRERRRLAKILHDHLQQLLYAAKLKTGLLHRTVQEENARRLLQQTTDLLDESLDESRSLAMELSPPVLYDRGLVGALEWLAREARQKHDLPVHLELDREADPRDEGTRVFLFEAIRELLLNVVKHAQASEARIELALLGEDRIRVVVFDTGRGFNPAETKARGTTTGFGLLSIRERLELLGGRMEIDSKPGEGTQVILEVPRGQSVTPAERAREVVAAASSVALGTGQALLQPPENQKEVRVVVADDHRVLREGLITVLHEQPEIEVVGEAADGQQALDLALCMKPDVVLMDVSMPGMDGIEATRRIKEVLPQVRIIGLSMHKQADMAAAMREAGATDYLSKEAASDALVAAVLAGKNQDA